MPCCGMPCVWKCLRLPLHLTWAGPVPAATLRVSDEKYLEMRLFYEHTELITDVLLRTDCVLTVWSVLRQEPRPYRCVQSSDTQQGTLGGVIFTFFAKQFHLPKAKTLS